MVQDAEDTRLCIEASPIGGLGVFTTVHISKGSSVLEMSGEILAWAETLKRIETGIEAVDDPLQIDEDDFVDLAHLPRLVNHSCDPNAGIRGRTELVAIRDIAAGEEVTYDYSATEGKDSDWSMACACGTSRCRRVIGNVSTIPLERLAAYAAAGGLQSYIWAQCATELASLAYVLYPKSLSDRRGPSTIGASSIESVLAHLLLATDAHSLPSDS